LPDYDVEHETITNPSELAALRQEELEAGENEDVCCYACGKTPCEWLEYGVDALDTIERRFNCATAQSEGYVVEIASDNKVRNKTIRFSLYRMFTYEKYGCLGKGNRMKIPDCVEGKVKELFPELDGNYVNFMPENDCGSTM
jgi:hypothetical protein